MEPTLLPVQVLLLAFLVLLIMLPRAPRSFWRQLHDQVQQLGHELDRHVDRNRWLRRLPVFSAETVRGKEAQLMRERAPRKAPRLLFTLALLVVGVLVWWLTR